MLRKFVDWLVKEHRERVRSDDLRKSLGRLSDHELDDIGLFRGQLESGAGALHFY